MGKLLDNLLYQWDYEKNIGIDPLKLDDCSNKKVSWICKEAKCGCIHRWDAIIQNRTKHNQKCSYCYGHKVDYHDSFGYLHPEMLKEWNYEKNEINPFQIKPGCNKYFHWKCTAAECGCIHEWFVSTNHRTRTESRCPYCYGFREVDYHKSLAYLHPDLLKEWDYEKNVDLDPIKLLPNSGEDAFWKCTSAKCGCIHSWKTQISHRTSKNPSNCPYCDGHKKVDYHNSIEYTHPEYLKEWNYELNEIKPSELSYGSDKEIVWKCIDCGKNWTIEASNRICSKTGCPHCCKSKGEKEIIRVLTKYNIEFIDEHTFDDCKYKQALPFDFYLPKYNLCYEYDGIQHTKPNKFFGGEKAFELCQIRDKIKNEYCMKNKINLLRIPYNFKMNDIEELINAVLNDPKQMEDNIKALNNNMLFYYFSY